MATLSRYQLRNPKTADTYPKDADIFPHWASWKAMRELDDKIHWEEIGRALTRCLRIAELEKGINRIRQARAAPDCLTHDPEVTGSNPVPATQSVGRNLRLG